MPAVIMVPMIVVMFAMLVVIMVMPAAAAFTMRVRVGVVMDMQHVARVPVIGVIMVSVIMLAMLVLAVVMAAAAGFAVGMVFMLVMPVRVVSVMMTVGLGRLIGAAFRLEGRVDDLDAGTEPARHFLQNRIPRDPDAVGEQFRRHVTIAKMPREPRQMMGVVRDDLGDRLLGGGDGHHPAVVEHQPVAILQSRRLRQVEQEDDIALAPHRDATAVPPVMGQHHTVDGGVRTPGAGGQQRARMNHDRLLGNMSGIW